MPTPQPISRSEYEAVKELIEEDELVSIRTVASRLGVTRYRAEKIMEMVKSGETPYPAELGPTEEGSSEEGEAIDQFDWLRQEAEEAGLSVKDYVEQLKNKGEGRLVFSNAKGVLDWIRKQGYEPIKMEELKKSGEELVKSARSIKIDVETQMKRIAANPVILMYYAYVRTAGYKGDLDSFLTTCVRDSVEARNVHLAFLRGG